LRTVGVAADLGYAHRRPNVVQRAMQAFASSRPGAWMFSKLLAPLDRVVHRLSKGKTTLPQVLAGLPVLFVTTTGRKSGQPRTTPLIAVPIGDTLALVGTNFGQPSTPAWVHNLEADPHARASYRERAIDVTTRPATDDERAAVWDAAAGVYPGYGKYQERIHGREIRIFVLEPAPTG
jgi:deazaflavin-dependent oxidoreductase (nitroreductase family)